MTTTINADNGVSSGSAGLKSSADSSGALQLQTNGTAALTIDTSQNVGIGTTSPQAKFNVFGTSQVLSNPAGTANDSNGFDTTTFSASTPYWSYLSYNASHFQWSIYNTEAMRINSSGNVGIGTSSPAALLHVGPLNGTGSLNGYTKLVVEATDYAVATWKSPAANISQIIFTDTTTTSLGGINYYNSSNATPNAMTFLTNAIERMRITSTGGVSFGATGTAYGTSGQVLTSAGNAPPTWITTLPVANGGTGVTTSTGSGAVVLGTSPTLTTPTINSAQVATVSGTAPLYMTRAWVNFDGTVATPSTIRGSGNVTSITRSATGKWQVNLTTAMTDANYVANVTIGQLIAAGGARMCGTDVALNTSSVVYIYAWNGTTFENMTCMDVSVNR